MSEELYLAHPSTHRRFVKALQQELEAQELNIINPFEGRPWYDDRYLDLKRGEPKHTELLNEHPEEDNPAVLVSRDLAKIDRSYGLIAYVPTISFGTSMEILYNSFIKGRGRGRTVILVDDINGYDKVLLDQFGTVVDVDGMTASEMAGEADKMTLNNQGPPETLRVFEDLHKQRKLVVNAECSSVEGAFLIMYNSLYLNRGKKETFVVTEKYKHHPWLRYFTTLIDGGTNAFDMFGDSVVYFMWGSIESSP